MSRGSSLDCKIYVGDLPRDASEKEVERAFGYYGPLRNVWVARNPAGFAFVEFEDNRDAEDATRALDGTYICGSRVRVEFSTGKVRPKPWLRGRGASRSRRPFHPDDKCYECGGRGHYAYDCSRGGSRGGHSGSSSRRRSRSRSRSYSRSRSRSRPRYSSRYSRSRSRSRGSRSASWDRGIKRTRSSSHSLSPKRMRRSRSRSPPIKRESPYHERSPLENGS